MNDTEIRERLVDLADAAPKGSIVPPTLVPRARRRAIVTIVLTAVVVLSLVISGIEGVRAIEKGRSKPVDQPMGTPSPMTLPLEGGALEPGSYAWDVDSLRITFDVPRGWAATGGGGVLKFGQGAAPPSGSALGFWTVDNVFINPCRSHLGLLQPPVGPTVDDLVTAIQNQQESIASKPTDITLDGHPGKHMQLLVPPRIKLADCDVGRFRRWVTPDGGERYTQGSAQHDELWIVDVHGVRLVIDISTFPGTPAADHDELEQMVASIHVD
jgi:hypothetical protein